MVTLLFLLVVVAAVAIALYSSMRGHGSNVTESDVGGINSYEAYYGKDAHSYGGTRPCEKCGVKGCIGVGQCRCRCHLAEQPA